MCDFSLLLAQRPCRRLAKLKYRIAVYRYCSVRSQQRCAGPYSKCESPRRCAEGPAALTALKASHAGYGSDVGGGDGRRGAHQNCPEQSAGVTMNRHTRRRMVRHCLSVLGGA